MNHTREPWSIWLHGDDWTIEAKSDDSGFMVDIGNASFSEENARRIVACVNALEGIPTDELEKAGTGLMSEAAICVGRLTKERDMLLAKLTKAATDYIDQNGSRPLWWTSDIVKMVQK